MRSVAPSFFIHIYKVFKQHTGRFRVERARRFIREDHGQVCDDRPCCRNALFLSSGHFAGIFIKHVVYFKRFGDILDTFLDLSYPTPHIVSASAIFS